MFEEGARDKTKKKKPRDVEKQMRLLRDDKGNLTFAVRERLSETQIRSWFSQYAREQKAQTLDSVIHNL